MTCTARPRAGVAGSKLPVGLLGAPFQALVSILSIVVAFSFLATAQHLDQAPVSILQAILSPPWVWIWGAFLAGGGAAVLVGQFSTGTRALAVEAVGLCLMSSAWIVYAVALIAEAGHRSTIPIGLAVVVALGSLIRVRALLISSRISATAGSSRTPEE